MIQLQSSASREKALEGPGQKHEILQDTTDAKRSPSEPSEQEQNERLQEVLQVKYKAEVFVILCLL